MEEDILKLIEKLKNIDWHVRETMILELGNIAVESKSKVIAKIINLIEEPIKGRHKFKQTALRLCELYEQEMDMVVDALVSILENDSDNHVRVAAANALGEIGELAKLAIPELTDASVDDDKSICIAASCALEKIGPEDDVRYQDDKECNIIGYVQTYIQLANTDEDAKESVIKLIKEYQAKQDENK